MLTSCPHCGGPVNVTVTLPPPPDRMPSPAPADALAAVVSGCATARQVAERMAGRAPSPAQVERARRLLDRLATDGELRVLDAPTSGGRAQRLYRVTSSPATG